MFLQRHPQGADLNYKVFTEYSINNDLIKIKFEIHNCDKFFRVRHSPMTVEKLGLMEL